MYNINEGVNTMPGEPEPAFFVNIGFEIDGELKYVSTTDLQEALKNEELSQESFKYVIKHLVETGNGRI